MSEAILHPLKITLRPISVTSRLRVFTLPFRIVGRILGWCILHYPDDRMGHLFRRRYLALIAKRVGRNLQVGNGCRLHGVRDMEIGDDSGIAPGCIIDLGPGSARFVIGDDTHIGPQTYIRNANHGFEDPTLPTSKQPHVVKDILIGSNVWVGARCILLGGTKIGDHCVIAAGSVVSFDIPAHSLAAGNPARVIKRLPTMPAT